jgi:hypothetical protein
MKQTAVEWLVDELILEGFYVPKGIYDKAKEMEKEQMRGASCPYVGGWEEGEFEDWYNETYNKHESNN